MEFKFPAKMEDIFLDKAGEIREELTLVAPTTESVCKTNLMVPNCSEDSLKSMKVNKGVLFLKLVMDQMVRSITILYIKCIYVCTCSNVAVYG